MSSKIIIKKTFIKSTAVNRTKPDKVNISLYNPAFKNTAEISGTLHTVFNENNWLGSFSKHPRESATDLLETLTVTLPPVLQVIPNIQHYFSV